MKKLLMSAAFILTGILTVQAQSWGGTSTSSRYQQGYTRSNGTYVQGHYKTNNNHTNHDNYSTRGNVNTYTNTRGSRARDYSVGAYNYGSGRTVHTGSRGGQYYINSRGNKTYVPKRY
jgi:hypothetical protein